MVRNFFSTPNINVVTYVVVLLITLLLNALGGLTAVVRKNEAEEAIALSILK